MQLSSKQRSRVAFGAFFACLATALAGADFPPPLGFLWMLPLAAIGAAAIYFRMPTYAAWVTAGKGAGLFRALAEGFAFGVAMGLLALAIPGTGDPTALHAVGPANLLIWLGVIGAMGAAGSAATYALAAALAKGER